MKNKKSKFIFRVATLVDVPNIVKLEENVWGENGANDFQLTSRIKIFPSGNIIAIYKDLVVGYLSFEYVGNVTKRPSFSWDNITDYGMIYKSHEPDSEYMYGINLSVHKSMSGQQLGFGLTLQAWINMILNNKKGIFIGSRIPGYHNYKKGNPCITPEEYIKIRRNGRLRDPELRMYERDGVCAVKILPNYFPDPPSEDYGVLLYRKNPFHNWPFLKLWAWLITQVPIKFRENISVGKAEKI